MPIVIDYTPIQAVGDLAAQAGSNEAKERSEAMEQQTMMAKMAHDDAMQKMEFQAQTQADAQFREQHFQRALQGQQFQQHELTLQEQYGWNLQLDKAKAGIALQAEIQKHQRLTQDVEANCEMIDKTTILDPKMKEFLKLQQRMRLTGGQLPTGTMQGNQPKYTYQTIKDPDTGKNKLVAFDQKDPTHAIDVGTSAKQAPDTTARDLSLLQNSRKKINDQLTTLEILPQDQNTRQAMDNLNRQLKQIDTLIKQKGGTTEEPNEPAATLSDPLGIR